MAKKLRENVVEKCGEVIEKKLDKKCAGQKNITFLERQLNKSIKEVVYPGDNGIDNKPGK